MAVTHCVYIIPIASLTNMKMRGEGVKVNPDFYREENDTAIGLCSVSEAV